MSQPANGSLPHDPPLPLLENDEPQVHAQPKKPVKPIYPLASWADTHQNTVCIAFLMGSVFTLALSNLSSLFTQSTPREALESSWARLVVATQSPRLGIYVAALVVFHLMEYLVTAIWNPSKVSVKCQYTSLL